MDLAVAHSGALIAPRNSDPGALLAMLGADGNQVVALGASQIDGTAVTAIGSRSARPGLRHAVGAGLPAGITGAAAEQCRRHRPPMPSPCTSPTAPDRCVAWSPTMISAWAAIPWWRGDRGPRRLREPIAVSPPPARQVMTLSQFQGAVQGDEPDGDDLGRRAGRVRRHLVGSGGADDELTAPGAPTVAGKPRLGRPHRCGEHRS